MSRKTPFILVDVFTSRPFGGNQLAVFTEGAALSASEMQELAHEMNFSESTFVMPPESSGARRVRIFTPKHEMPMAGHPTVGTTWVLASRGEIPLDSASVDATVHLGIGPVTVTIENTGGKPDFVWMGHRAAEFGAKRHDRGRIAKALGITAADIRDDLPIQAVSTGVPFLFVPVRSLDALAKCAVNAAALAALFKPGETILPVYMFVANEAGEFAPRSRMFGPHDGVPEDPATGGASAPFGAYAATYKLIDPAPKAAFLIRQGVEMGRPSEIHVEVARKDSGSFAIRIGGRCAIVGEGAMFL
ncbi:MAG TPA: PhzF family phenazine biosynthesis protein [Candidatus Binatus sp.]|uniref:PhzF family phenazine biosynthesis protein n=1 Tax=Candidatus Binatus sp. TaxID=2811406 RepID=UPI002B47F2A7|nr:PhzF family phenazine biosynthesis protein [Candidatus Binatus sp.]HKN14488.1 PhzF family phenazine biosynthesis protein [Candidatus Binatus sp.]